MTKPKYASAEERRAAMSAQAKLQMQAQWEREREQSGRDLGYYGCHRRVRTERGRAADQPCAHCGKRAQQWAHVHDTDPADTRNYIALCRPCHVAYDDVTVRSRMTKGPEGRSREARVRWSRRSSEERREIIRKGWETRRRNQGEPDVVACDPALDGD
jgi:hypothetical protein